MPQRRAPVVTSQVPAEEDNDEDDNYSLVSGRVSLGLGGRAQRSVNGCLIVLGLMI